ncbi:MAG: Rne/Rng family ribonuclease [Actinobacteria bacterium]|nr:Rne/Rng family ribonuclease [Actinomycetota bacterium]MSW90835.1 Rne/Rng family ribonuclease [Actinomycetota bacterium]MSX88111.1 Rne/Rng family ribonuclease [Actinomycetota bacterium]MSY72472.1 Rne/Rng family ribonuclease [Actinomycetota bacterium]
MSDQPDGQTHQPSTLVNPTGSSTPVASPTAEQAGAPDTPARRKPQIGDTIPAAVVAASSSASVASTAPVGPDGAPRKRRRRGGRGRGGGGGGGGANGSSGPGGSEAGEAREPREAVAKAGGGASRAPRQKQQPRGGGRKSVEVQPVQAFVGDDETYEIDEKSLKRRSGRERNGRPVGRYFMCVSVRSEATQIAILEGRSLLEQYVSRPSDDVAQIHGNIYLGKVQNVLPGMEAAFVDIGTPKNAVLYRGDVQFDSDEVEQKGQEARIEQILQARQKILCQVTKNPIAHKGARLTQEVSLPGRFVVLIPNSSTYGISKRLSDNERKRLRAILDKVRPEQHGIIVRTAAENVTSDEIERDVARLVKQWTSIEALAAKATAPALLYREPDMALRVIREEFNADYRGVVIDDREIFEDVRDYVASISPTLADRVEYFDRSSEPLSLFERHHVHEQIHKALDKKVWLQSGGSLIIEHTEALTVIDVNTGKNVGSSSLEETVYRNNLEAAEEIARQLRLRDIGGIIVIDFVDMEVKANREAVIRKFRDALARDKTRTHVFDISELGLVQMTRKRIGEGLLESFATACPECEGRGVILSKAMLDR